MAEQGAPDLLPARMLNEYVYCPRLFHLEWVQGEFRDNPDVAEGRLTHRRVDKEQGDLPPAGEAEDEARPRVARSVMLSAPAAGIIARMDIVESEGTKATPVDYKKGEAPNIPEGAWEPDRVQVCAQGIVLRENGYACDGGVIYYAKSKKRVDVPFTDELVRRTLEVRDLARRAAEGPIPPPLVDSPKCPRCSLVTICLPDETNYLAIEAEQAGGTEDIRRLFPARDDALPLYVQEQGASIGKSGELLDVKYGKQSLQKVRLLEVSQVSVFGNVQVSAQAVKTMCDRAIPLLHFSYGGWFYGVTTGMAHKNVELRRRQFAVMEDVERSLPLARAAIAGKIRNCRTLLRRNAADAPPAALDELERLAGVAEAARDGEMLLGIEGAAGRVYFAHFSDMLKVTADGRSEFHLDFQSRNRRPATDPVNSLLSYLYAVLTKDVTVTLLAVGFDPYLGFFHRPRYGRPALALDMMEEFRPIIVDSVVISLINNGEIRPDHFVRRGPAVNLTPDGKKKVLGAYERRMDSTVTHPTFGYTISYRRILEVQARLLSRVLTGELSRYTPFCTR